MSERRMTRPILNTTLLSATLGMLFGLASYAEPSETPRASVKTRGVSVTLGVEPRCRLAGDDTEAGKRAEAFLRQLRSAIGSAVAEVEFPLGFPEWAAEVDLESEALPPTSHVSGIRLLKPDSDLDRPTMRAMYRGRMPKLPNFRARCSFVVRISPWQADPE